MASAHGFIQPFVLGEYETVRGEDRVAEATSRGAKRERGKDLEKGCLPSQGWEYWPSGGVTGKILEFETRFGAIWCIQGEFSAPTGRVAG